uniref:ATP-dependent RNA helicase DHX29 n=1 Tax=Oncorhynchus mykiss TaxID=8022 RepID=A0A8C7VYC1_ONCMY
MGGKKKKSATIPTVQPAAAGNNVPAVGNGVADPATTGKKQKPTPAKSAVKDIKPKGPKTYSLTNTAQVDTGGVTDKSILKVVIQTDLEKKIIKLINDFRQENGDKGPISGRLTNKKLLDLYLALQKFKFKTEHIEEAMKSSVLYGGDLHSALDWLCLNLKDEELPAGFSQRMQEENHETKPKFQPAPQAPEPESPKEPKKEPAKYCFPSLWSCDLYDAKEMAATAKAKKDKGGQRTAQDRIRVIQQEMKPLESHPMFNTVIKVVDMPKIEEKKPPAPTEGKEELAFGLFEQAEKETPPPAEKSKYELIKCLFGQSEGRTPFQVVKTWSLVSTGIVSPRVRVQRLDDVLEVCPNILTEDGMQAQHLGATLAIYNLCKGQSVHMLIPPTYREVWLEWRDSEQAEEEELRTAINKPRDQFITRLLTRLKQQQPQKKCPSPQPGLQGAGDELEDDWESLANLEEEEDPGKTITPKERGGGVAEVAARALLLKLRGSALSRRLQTDREQLPVFQHRVRVMEALRRNRVVVVAGETGSGKSTQIPQFILEELLTGGAAAQPCNIVVTQPRRISAMSLASRVSQELGCDDGPGSKSSLCGYQIRMENKSSDSTRLLYCTTGVLLRKLQQDHMLSSLTHIIVDEVHERSVQSDFLLTILKDVVQKRSNLHLVMMSATVDCDKFAAYFNRCPIVNIPGRTFPVEVFHLEDIVEETGYVLEKDSEYSQKILEEEEEVNINFTQKGGKSMQHQEFIVKDTGSGWDLGPDLDHFSSRTRHALQYMNPNKINMELVLDLLDYLDKSPQFAVVDGAVLVFLPGLAHIQQLYDLLSTDKRFRGKDRYKLVALHSTLSSKDQAAAFTVPPTGVRKIVLSTNIAETGVTIPDVVFVIDTGKTKENKYHESSQMSSLVETFVSKASALQRQGRAGRVRDGFCFRLYPKFRFQAFMDYSIPEILRVPLEELCLHIMKCEYGSPEEFLCRALDAPQPQSVSNAVCLLRRIGACIPEGHALTPLGHHLATLPVNVKIGKMLIFGAILGCLDPIATIAAAISEKSPFATPMNQKDQANLAKAALAVANSDHLTIYNAYLGWKNIRSEGYRAEMAYCRKHFLNRTALITIEVLYFLTCVCVWFSHLICFNSEGPQAPLTPLGKPQICVLNAVLTAGLYDSVGRILYTPSVDVLDRVACSVETAQGKAQVHPSSVNRCLQTRGWLLFQEKVKYSKIYLRDTTLISPFPMLLFGGDIDVQHRERLISLDGWIHFQAPVRIGVIFKHLRKLIDSLLEKKLENPRMNLEDEKTIQLIIELIKMENVF